MEIVKVNKKNLEEAAETASKAIEKGKVIVSPTDTVYGILCDATNKNAVRNLFKIKKRERENRCQFL